VTPDSGPDRPIFVVGCARSGTTLLQLMLHAHPRIAIPPETRFLTEAYERRAEFGDLRVAANIDALVDWVMVDPQQRLVRDLELDTDEVRRRAHEVEPTIGSILGLVLKMYAERWDKPRWGDKRPSYFKRMDEILAMFPDAQFVHLIRDGRDCVASLQHMSWWGSGSVGAMQNWMAAMQVGARCRRRLRADQYHELYYEDLVGDARTELQRLCAFLGEDFDEAMLEPDRVAEEAVPRRKRRRHHKRTTDRVSDQAVGRWTGDLEPWEITLMEAVAGRELRRHGYALTHDRRPLPPPRAAVRYARQVARSRWRYLSDRLRERRVARAYDRPVAARLTAAQRDRPGAA
jgi:hypothetical protein